jgi:hypothetical protein
MKGNVIRRIAGGTWRDKEITPLPILKFLTVDDKEMKKLVKHVLKHKVFRKT